MSRQIASFILWDAKCLLSQLLEILSENEGNAKGNCLFRAMLSPRAKGRWIWLWDGVWNNDLTVDSSELQGMRTPALRLYSWKICRKRRARSKKRRRRRKRSTSIARDWGGNEAFRAIFRWRKVATSSHQSWNWYDEWDSFWLSVLLPCFFSSLSWPFAY